LSSTQLAAADGNSIDFETLDTNAAACLWLSNLQ